MQAKQSENTFLVSMTAAGKHFSWFLQCPTTTTMARESFLIHRETWIRIRVWGNSKRVHEREKNQSWFI